MPSAECEGSVWRSDWPTGIIPSEENRGGELQVAKKDGKAQE